MEMDLALRGPGYGRSGGWRYDAFLHNIGRCARRRATSSGRRARWIHRFSLCFLKYSVSTVTGRCLEYTTYYQFWLLMFYATCSIVQHTRCRALELVLVVMLCYSYEGSICCAYYYIIVQQIFDYVFQFNYNKNEKGTPSCWRRCESFAERTRHEIKYCQVIYR